MVSAVDAEAVDHHEAAVLHEAVLTEAVHHQAPAAAHPALQQEDQPRRAQGPRPNTEAEDTTAEAQQHLTTLDEPRLSA